MGIRKGVSLSPFFSYVNCVGNYGMLSLMKDDETQYIHLPKLERTDTPNPIQGRVKGPDQLYHFIRDVHDATTPKMWGIFLMTTGVHLVMNH